MGRAQPYKIIIVEDEPLLALDLHCTLEDAGYSVIGNSGSVTAVKALIERSLPDAVVLDVLLQRQPNFELADILADRRIPFMFLTVCEPELVVPRHQQRPLLRKPCTGEQLLLALKDLISGCDGAAATPLEPVEAPAPGADSVPSRLSRTPISIAPRQTGIVDASRGEFALLRLRRSATHRIALPGQTN